MKKMLLIVVAITAIFMGCKNGNGSAADTDTNVSSTTAPPKADTNPIGIMMGDTTIGINDSLKKNSLKK
jgi:hypothetical protein